MNCRLSPCAAVGIVCFLFAPVTAAGQTTPAGHCIEPGANDRQDPGFERVGCTDSGGSPGGSRPRTVTRPTWVSCVLTGGLNCPPRVDKAVARSAAAWEENHQGVVASFADDWPTALSHFEKALKITPDSVIIRENVVNARESVALRQEQQRAANEAAERIRQDEAAVNNMRRSLEKFGQTLNAASPAGGLDFDGGTPGNAPGGSTRGGLDFTANDPMVVNTQKAPSDRSKALDDSIAGVYGNAPPGVSDRVRKGFQAVMTRDWKVAHAWFEEALNRDPGNARLKHMVELTEYTVPERQTATSTGIGRVPGTNGYSPSRAEIDEFVRNAEAGRFTQPLEVRE